MSEAEYRAAVVRFVAGAQEVIRRHCEANGRKAPTLHAERFGDMTTTRIFWIQDVKRSAWAFIGAEGYIYRVKSWNESKTRPQGNIFDRDAGLTYITADGPRRPEDRR